MSNVIDFSKAKDNRTLKEFINNARVFLTEGQKIIDTEDHQAGHRLVYYILETIKNLPAVWLTALAITFDNDEGFFKSSFASNLRGITRDDESQATSFLSFTSIQTPMIEISLQQHNESIKAWRDFILNEVSKRPDHRWQYLEIFIGICNHLAYSNHYRIHFEAISETEFSITGGEKDCLDSHFVVWGNILTKYEGLLLDE